MKRENRKFKNKWNQTREERQDLRHGHGKELVVESLKLPKDSLLGASIVTLTGNTEVFVENYKGIIEYTSQMILLQGKTCKIEICGRRLNIVYYTNEDMKINGCVEAVRYLM
ncbi:MAG: YabP/YqfC family sporulation protein [Lachnospiraceae bacterium]|nr:YabP/YqfC family sporulation protein [Lachnospiraceae bacterium]MDE6183996.1 YabP/YqfC family sporulation protein [Lachnospiraceae bacterium]MDE7287164.1 YabP/YqfC family sporulation protein [Lachnospiraceae bacterium]